MLNFRKHMNNEHPCLVQKLEEIENMIGSGAGLKIVSISNSDMSIPTDIIIPASNIITPEQLEIVRNSDIICDGIVGQLSPRYYVKSYVTIDQIRFNSYNDLSGEAITITFDSDGKYSKKYDKLKNESVSIPVISNVAKTNSIIGTLTADLMITADIEPSYTIPNSMVTKIKSAKQIILHTTNMLYKDSTSADEGTYILNLSSIDLDGTMWFKGESMTIYVKNNVLTLNLY